MDNPWSRLQSLKEPLLPIPDGQLSERFFSLRRRSGSCNHPPQLTPPVVDRIPLVVLVVVP